MEKLYRIALSEGEGLGTAYEYFVKLKLLNKHLDKETKTVLIYGLPEKYGFSMDFIYFCDKNNLKLDIIEKREDKIKKLKEILEYLKEKNIFSSKSFETVKQINKKYDLILSSEVLQSLNKEEQKEYVKNVKKYSRKAIIFVPNKDNKLHNKISGLNGFSLMELKEILPDSQSCGYIDIPPFPPGIKKKKPVKNKSIIKILNLFAYLETFIPFIIKKRTAHICYALN